MEEEEQLNEFRSRWRRQSIIIKRVIDLERLRDHPLDLWDLYTCGKFTNDEINWLDEEGILKWLLDGLTHSRYFVKNSHPVGDGSGGNSELCDIIRLCPRSQPQNQDFYKGVGVVIA